MNLRIKDVSKQIKGESVLQHINLEMNGGNIYGIYGKNGSGKTMLLRCISGIANINSGQIICDGQKLHKDIDILPNMGLLIENVSFWRMYTGFDNLKMLSRIRGEIGDEQICEAMKLVGLNPGLKKNVGKYSLGMRQKLAIAQAIMEYPDVILLDEPTNALDEKSVERFRRIMLMEKERGALIVIASHNKEDIELLSDVKIHVKNGQIGEYKTL